MHTSAHIAAAIFDLLLEKLQSQLTIRQLTQLAPTNTAVQANQAITAMLSVTYPPTFPASSIYQQKDPRPARMDTLATGKIDREVSADPRDSPVQQKMRSLATERSKNSYRSGRFAKDPSLKGVSPSIKDKQSIKSKERSFFVSLCPESQEDVGLESMRQAQNDRMTSEAKIKRQQQEQARQRERNAIAGLKLIREKKSFTFDYEGVSQGVTPITLPTDSLRRMKQQLKEGEVLKRDRMCQTMQVPSKQKAQMGKTFRGEAPFFSQKGFSVVEALGDTSHLSQGIKITEIRGNSSNISLEHRAKRPEGKAYRLKDYQNLSKQKSFREFPLTSSRKNSLLQLTDSAIDPSDSKMKTIRKERAVPSRGHSEEMIKAQKEGMMEQALGRGLPFIRTKGLRFYDIGSANSLKTVDFSLHSSGKSSWRSKIKISDASLYDDVLLA